MKRLIPAMLLIAALAGCSDDTAGPGGSIEKGFLLRVVVTDADGDPVPGIRVSAHHMVSVPFLFRGKFTRRSPGAAVSIPFTLAEEAGCELIISDLNDSPVRTLVQGSLPAGRHTIIWDGLDDQGDQIPGGVYLCRLRTGDAADSALVDYLEIDPRKTVLGYTDSEGIFHCRKRLAFPGTYDLPAICWTNGHGDSIGTFTCLDSVRITLTDTVNGRMESYRIEVLNEVNVARLTWNPSGPVPYGMLGRVLEEAESAVFDYRAAEPPDTTALEHPFPNPFY